MQRTRENPLRRGLLDDLARVHDRNYVRLLGDDAQIMGNKKHGHAELLLKFANEFQNLRLNGDVERRGRFVGDQELRRAGERHGDHHALPLAAGKLMRVAAHPLLRFWNL